MFGKDQIFFRAVLRVLRATPFARDFMLKVRRGPLQGARWCVGFADNSAILGDHDQGVTEVFSRACRPGNVIFDLGASGGYMALIASRRVGPDGKVYAFEPLPANLEYLRLHVCVNGADNVSIQEYAISDHDGFLEFSNSPEHPMANTAIAESPVFRGKQLVKVGCRAIDSWRQAILAPGPNLIKIDIEGAELLALHGARATIQQFKPWVLLSTHDAHLPGVHQGCLKFLSELGYQTLDLIDRKYSFPGIAELMAWHPDNPWLD